MHAGGDNLFKNTAHMINGDLIHLCQCERDTQGESMYDFPNGCLRQVVIYTWIFRFNVTPTIMEQGHVYKERGEGNFCEQTEGWLIVRLLDH